ncbi:hypothetical protein M885DRAFT_511110 [Pelagophyceae sp. CCMP2097]|nr:hypothetical protein M885DRAFT_511110 [Pelagophyceae sp. CCMP2097]
MDADSDDDLNFDDIYEEASRADDDGAAGDSAAAPEREAVDLAALTSSADRDVWSQRNRVWRLNAVALPRLSLPGEANDDWVEKYFPHALTDFAGAATVNREALYALKKQVEMLELANFIIAGPRGSGKTAAALALARAWKAAPERPRQWGVTASGSRGSRPGHRGR